MRLYTPSRASVLPPAFARTRSSIHRKQARSRLPFDGWHPRSTTCNRPRCKAFPTTPVGVCGFPVAPVCARYMTLWWRTYVLTYAYHWLVSERVSAWTWIGHNLDIDFKSEIAMSHSRGTPDRSPALLCPRPDAFPFRFLYHRPIRSPTHPLRSHCLPRLSRRGRGATSRPVLSGEHASMSAGVPGAVGGSRQYSRSRSAARPPLPRPAAWARWWVVRRGRVGPSHEAQLMAPTNLATHQSHVHPTCANHQVTV
jgi:hypothetical protein